MALDSPSSPQQTPPSSDAEDYPVWKRWGDIDEHSKSRKSQEGESASDQDRAWERLKAQLRAKGGNPPDNDGSVPTDASEMRNGRPPASPADPNFEVDRYEQSDNRVGTRRNTAYGFVNGKGAESSYEARKLYEADPRGVSDYGTESPSRSRADVVVPANDPVAAGAHDRLDSDAPAGDQRQANTPARDFRSWEADFSALDIRDRVVIMLLFKQVVQIDEVEAAWRRFQKTNQGRSREPLWRILARDPAFDRERILAEAAKSAGYEKAHINPVEAAAFIDSQFSTFSEADWERMLTLNVVPVAKEEDARSGRARYVFVSPDPTRPGVSNLIRDLKLGGHVLRFSPEHVLDSLLADLTGRGGFDDTSHVPPTQADVQLHDPLDLPEGATPSTKDEADQADQPTPVDEAALIGAEGAEAAASAESATPESATPDQVGTLDEAALADERALTDEPALAEEPASEGPSAAAGSMVDAEGVMRHAVEPDSGWDSPETAESDANTPGLHTSEGSREARDLSASNEARQLLEKCLGAAVDRKASGVHLLPVENGLQIDMRIDGELENWQSCSQKQGDDLLAVVKEEALNIQPSESDSVQDGLIKREIGGTSLRFGVSVLPIAGSFSADRRESIVISILGDEVASASTLDAVGLPTETLEHIRSAIAEPRGMVVLAGPSGSGRGATLSAILNEIVTPKVNVITLEESVTHEAQGVRQVRLNHKLDHEDALEAVRRHDPDIILVGELRTKEAAELALKLANAGHLVFSRMPTHDTTGVVGRLLRLGVDPFLIAYAINLVVAQRLVKRLCPDCKQPAKHIDGELLRKLGFSRQEIASSTFYDEGVNADCPTCSVRRYDGTQIIAEAWPFTDDTRRLIALADASLDDEDVRAHAVREGMTTIRSSARDVVLTGATSVGEMIRVTAGAS